VAAPTPKFTFELEQHDQEGSLMVARRMTLRTTYVGPCHEGFTHPNGSISRAGGIVVPFLSLVFCSRTGTDRHKTNLSG
jgi:hypothetical protein